MISSQTFVIYWIELALTSTILLFFTKITVRSAKDEIDGPPLKYQVLGRSSFGIRLKSENADTSITIPLKRVTE